MPLRAVGSPDETHRNSSRYWVAVRAKEQHRSLYILYTFPQTHALHSDDRCRHAPIPMSLSCNNLWSRPHSQGSPEINGVKEHDIAERLKALLFRATGHCHVFRYRRSSHNTGVLRKGAAAKTVTSREHAEQRVRDTLCSTPNARERYSAMTRFSAGHEGNAYKNAQGKH